jgi:VanZ family protein
MSMGAAQSAPAPAAGRNPRKPIWPYARLCWTLGWVYTALVIYGSLLPFQLDLQPPVRRPGDIAPWLAHVFTSPRWQGAAFGSGVSSLGVSNRLSDTILNLLLYLPAGAFFRLAARREGRSALRQVVPVVLALGGLSYLMECAQSQIIGRSASWDDVSANTAGAAVGALRAIVAARVWKRLVFAIYRRKALLIYRARLLIRRQRRRAVMLHLAVGAALAAIVLTCATATPAHPLKQAAANWLPFGVEFRRSYDVAGVLIARRLLIYVLVAVLLALQFVRQISAFSPQPSVGPRSGARRRPRGLAVVSYGVAAFALVSQGMAHALLGSRFDVTEIVLALLAAGLVTALAYVTASTMRAACRRRNPQPVAHERRRIPHVYE